MLKAGYIENRVFHRTHSGTPQGGVASPNLMGTFPLDRLWEPEVPELLIIGDLVTDQVPIRICSSSISFDLE